MPWHPKKLRFELSLEELKELRSLCRYTEWSISGKTLIKKLENYISQLEAFEEKQRFRKPCRFGGFCREEELYIDCIKDERIKNNWMCWRDGILEEEIHSSLGKVKK